MAVKIKIGKSGYNVLTDTNVDHLVFSSDYDTLKYYTSGSTSMSISGGSNEKEVNVTHSLGYTPVFVAFLELDFTLGSGSWACVPWNFDDTFTRATVTASADSSKIYFTAKTTGTFGAITLNFEYKIFRNDTNL